GGHGEIHAAEGVLNEVGVGHGLDGAKVTNARQTARDQVVVIVPRGNERLELETNGFRQPEAETRHVRPASRGGNRLAVGGRVGIAERGDGIAPVPTWKGV